MPIARGEIISPKYLKPVFPWKWESTFLLQCQMRSRSSYPRASKNRMAEHSPEISTRTSPVNPCGNCNHRHQHRLQLLQDHRSKHDFQQPFQLGCHQYPVTSQTTGLVWPLQQRQYNAGQQHGLRWLTKPWSSTQSTVVMKSQTATQGSKPQSMLVLVAEGCATMRAILIWVTSTIIKGHDVVMARAAAKIHVWVCHPTSARAWVDVPGFSYHRGHVDVWGLVTHLRPC